MWLSDLWKWLIPDPSKIIKTVLLWFNRDLVTACLFNAACKSNATCTFSLSPKFLAVTEPFGKGRVRNKAWSLELFQVEVLMLPVFSPHLESELTSERISQQVPSLMLPQLAGKDGSAAGKPQHFC